MTQYVDYITAEDYEGYDLLQHTNVWQAGLVLWCLVTLRRPKEAVWLADGSGSSMYQFEMEEEDQYSQSLLDLIQSCLQESMLLRPKFDEVLSRIQNFITGHGDLQVEVNEMRVGTASAEVRRENELSYAVADSYAHSMAWASGEP